MMMMNLCAGFFDSDGASVFSTDIFIDATCFEAHPAIVMVLAILHRDV